MTIDEAIAHAKETAYTRTDLCDECREEHKQLAQWLTELKELRITLNGDANVPVLLKGCFK